MSCPAWDSATKKESSVKFLCREHRDGSQAPPSKEQSVEDLQRGPWVHDPPQPTEAQAPLPQGTGSVSRGESARLGKQHDLPHSKSLVARVSGNREGEWEREGEEGGAGRAVGVPYGSDLCSPEAGLRQEVRPLAASSTQAAGPAPCPASQGPSSGLP